MHLILQVHSNATDIRWKYQRKMITYAICIVTNFTFSAEVYLT